MAKNSAELMFPIKNSMSHLKGEVNHEFGRNYESGTKETGNITAEVSGCGRGNKADSDLLGKRCKKNEHRKCG